MLVSALRYTRKFNLGNYESEDIAIEAVPDDGQTAEELLAACRDFVLTSRGLPKGAPVASSNGRPPLAPSANGTHLSSGRTPGEQAVIDKQKEMIAVSPATPSNNGNGKRGKGRPPKAYSEAKKLVDVAMQAPSMADFLKAFNDARAKANAFTIDEWETICKELGGVYKKLNSVDADPQIVSAVVSAFQAERTAIDTKRNGAVAA